MKNIITLLLATACSINSLWASIVPMQTAQVVATNFYRQNNIGITSFAVLAYTEKSPSGDALFYVFNMSGNGGFVIVSADNVVEPIIGYSNTGQYIMPEKGTNIDFWMQVKKKEIIGAKVKGIPATKEIASKWSNYKNSTTSIVSRQQHRVNSIFPSNTNYLVQTTWNQEPYYNAMCPGGSVTGCVATAMSQIMRYWQFPATGTSAHCYSSSYGTLCADFDTVQYRWKEMPLSLSASTPSGQSQEVAKLMYDAGVSVDMEYSPSGSGAWVIKGDDDSVCAQIAYYKYFKYDSNSIQGFRASSFSYVEWQTLIENELNNSRPVEYAGWDPLAGGHTWVCDGYNSLNQFHMNWGWGGQDNGWFALNNLDPGGLDFSVGFEAVIGIEPSGSSSCSLVAN
ncbi:MAG TPA: C10 family peptidase, partial [Bacteroidia bacterium]|nr:C10 family peptidase [Bacteroidia bacterium]